jgi:hypothetical protein
VARQNPAVVASQPIKLFDDARRMISSQSSSFNHPTSGAKFGRPSG